MVKELTKRNQLPGLSTLQVELNRSFDRFLRNWDLTAFGREGLFPPVNVKETDDTVIVKTEIPGVDPNEVEISIQNNSLHLKGEKKEEKEEKGETFQRIESQYGIFSRSINLPAKIDTDKVTAECKNGVLVITLRKKEEAKSKHIPIKASE